MRFYMPADKKYLHEPEIQYHIYKKWRTTNAQKLSKCLILMELSIVRILSDQFAAWHNDATAQPGLETSNQAFK